MSAAARFTAYVGAAAQAYDCPARLQGVYFLMKNDQVVYVGKSVDIPVRVREHVNTGMAFNRLAILEVEPIGPVKCEYVEAYFIDLLMPSLNSDPSLELRRRVGPSQPPRFASLVVPWLKGRHFKGLATPAPEVFARQRSASTTTSEIVQIVRALIPTALSSGVLRKKQLEQLTGRSYSSIRRDMAAGTFPKPIQIGLRAIGWRCEEINEWLAARPEPRLQGIEKRASSADGQLICATTNRRCQRSCGGAHCAIQMI